MKKLISLAAALLVAASFSSCNKESDKINIDEKDVVAEGEKPSEDVSVKDSYRGKTLLLGMKGASEGFEVALKKRLTKLASEVTDDISLIVIGESFDFNEVSNLPAYAKMIEMYDQGFTVALLRPSCEDIEAFRARLCQAYDMYVQLQTVTFGSEVKAPESVKNTLARFALPEDSKGNDKPYEVIAFNNTGMFYSDALSDLSSADLSLYGEKDNVTVENDPADVSVTQYDFGKSAECFIEWLNTFRQVAEETKSIGEAALCSTSSSNELESIVNARTDVYDITGYVPTVPYTKYRQVLKSVSSLSEDQFPKDQKYDLIPSIGKVIIRIWGCHSHVTHEDYYLVKQEITSYNGRLMQTPVETKYQWHFHEATPYTRYMNSVKASLSMADAKGVRASIESSTPQAENSETQYSHSVARTTGWSFGGGIGGNVGYSNGVNGGGSVGFNFNYTDQTTITNQTSYSSKDIEVVKNSPSNYEVNWTYTGNSGFPKEDNANNDRLMHMEGVLQRSDCTLDQTVVFKIPSNSEFLSLTSCVSISHGTLVKPLTGDAFFTSASMPQKHTFIIDPPARSIRRWTMNIREYGNLTTIEQKTALVNYLNSNCSRYWIPYAEVGEVGKENKVMIGNWNLFRKFIDTQKSALKALGCSGEFVFVCQNLDDPDECWTHKLTIE